MVESEYYIKRDIYGDYSIFNEYDIHIVSGIEDEYLAKIICDEFNKILTEKRNLLSKLSEYWNGNTHSLKQDKILDLNVLKEHIDDYTCNQELENATYKIYETNGAVKLDISNDEDRNERWIYKLD